MSYRNSGYRGSGNNDWRNDRSNRGGNWNSNRGGGHRGKTKYASLQIQSLFSFFSPHFFGVQPLVCSLVFDAIPSGFFFKGMGGGNMGGGNMGGGGGGGGGNFGGPMGNGMGPGMGNGGMQLDQANLNNLMGTLLSNLERNIIQRQTMGVSVF